MQSSHAEIILRDIHGKKVFTNETTLPVNPQNGKYDLYVELPELSSGMYLFELKNERFIPEKKILKT